MKSKKTLTEIAHHLLKLYINSESIMVDATIGNGFDTLFLCLHSKFVYGFDIQQQALIETQKKLLEHSNYQLFLDSHLNIKNHITYFDGIIFNLGYLPGGNKAISTKALDTLSMMHLLESFTHHFFALMMVYPGHVEGAKESAYITNWLKEKQHRYIRVSLENTVNLSPYIILIDFN